MESDYGVNVRRENNSLSMDIQNLISCIHWHDGSNNDQVIIETLKTITDLCTNNEFGRDALRDDKGLEFLVEFMFTTDNAAYLEHSLKTLACVVDGNIQNKMFLTKNAFFEMILTILRNYKFPVIVRKNAIVLVSAILYQNSTAQSSICEVGLLQDLLNIYEQGAERSLSGSSPAPTSDDPLNELWITSISSLCFAVNNPKHETNQVLCSTIFQISLRILEFSTNTDVIGSVSSLLTFCISNNRYCQDKFAQNDGLLACKRFFQKHFNLVLADIRDCNNIIRKEALHMLSSVTGIISASVHEHESNADVLGRLGLVSLLVELLFVKTLDIDLKTKIVLSLGHSIDACSKNKGHVIGVNNFNNLLKENFCLQNNELSSACKYLLQTCLMQEEFDQEENIQNTDCPLDENIASKSFNKESACKITSPEYNKSFKESKEKSSMKRPSSCMSGSNSQKENGPKKLLKSSPTKFYDKFQPKRPHTGSENIAANTSKNKNDFRNIFPTLNDAVSSSNDSFLSAKSLDILKDILANSPGSESEISGDSSDSSSPYYPAEVLLEELKSEVESSDSRLTENIPLAKAKSAQDGELPNLLSRDQSSYDKLQDRKQRILRDRANLRETEFQPSPKKRKFNFESVMPSPKSPKVGSSRKQNFCASTDFPCSSTNERCAGNIDKVGEKTKRPEKFLSSLSSVTRSPSEDDFVQVIVFPGEKCEEHNLISSFESLQVVPLDQVKRP